jgi:hypothetical protein
MVHHLGFLPSYHSLGFLPATCNNILTIHVIPLTEFYTSILLYYKASCLSYFLCQITFCCCICSAPWASYVLRIKSSLNFISDFPSFFHTLYNILISHIISYIFSNTFAFILSTLIAVNDIYP